MHKLDWDDLQIIIAVARTGSASRAASAIGFNHATVLRRIDAFEKNHNVTLFERQPTGMRPTQACEALLLAARPIDDAVIEIRHTILGQDLKLSGPIRLTTTDSIANHVLVEPLRSFRERHPEIVIDLLITNTRVDLVRLGADISIRPSRNPPKQLIGRNVAPMSFAIYATPALAKAHPDPFSPDTVWIGIHHDLANSPAFNWMGEIETRNPIAARVNTFVAARDLVAADMGIAVLPCFLADRDDRLIRLAPPQDELETSIWVLTPRNLAKSARVRALSDHLLRALKKQRDLFTGKTGKHADLP